MVIRELEDFAWFPPLLRRFQGENIGENALRMRVYRAIVPPLRQLLSQSDAKSFTDLCSGSGLPAYGLLKEMQDKRYAVTCTDLYPQGHAPHANVTMHQESVDVLALLPEQNSVYTMLNAFHHFDDLQKKEIVHKMLHRKSSFLFAEILEPGIVSLMLVLLASIAGTLVFTPLIRPFSWQRLLLTYVLPVNVLTVLIDGILSVLRATDDRKLTKLFHEEILQGHVKVDRKFSFPVIITTIQST